MNQAPSSSQALFGSAQIDPKVAHLGGWREHNSLSKAKRK